MAISSSANLGGHHAKIRDALMDRSPRLAGMYCAALRELDADVAPGLESARVSIICHCMREVMNGLPAVMAVGSTPRPNPSSVSLTGRLPDLVAAHSGFDLRAAQDIVPVPSAIAAAIADLVAAAVKERGINVANAAALLTDGADTKHPLISQWNSAQRFFLQWTHLDRNPDAGRSLPTDDEVRTNIRVVEDVIDVRTAVFFENLSAVEDILNIANATATEETE